MKKMHRNTSLNAKEILDLINQGSHSYPKCMLLNEIGSVYINGEDEDKIAENYLMSLLKSDHPDERATSFFYLSCNPEKHEKILIEFRSNPDNESLLPFIDEKLEEFQAEA